MWIKQEETVTAEDVAEIVLSPDYHSDDLPSDWYKLLAREYVRLLLDRDRDDRR